MAKGWANKCSVTDSNGCFASGEALAVCNFSLKQGMQSRSQLPSTTLSSFFFVYFGFETGF